MSSATHRQPVVLLVAENPLRLRALRQRIAAASPASRIECFSSCGEALLRATHLPDHFMVMDMPHTGVLAPALRRFLARSAPQATVHWIESGAAFADSDLDPDRLHRVLAALDSYTQERVAH
mgnify:FL=1